MPVLQLLDKIAGDIEILLALLHPEKDREVFNTRVGDCAGYWAEGREIALFWAGGGSWKSAEKVLKMLILNLINW